MSANNKYKDSVFSFLFSNPDTLRELYGALSGLDLPADTPVIVNTLQDVLFMDMINDISFVIGGKLVVLMEHQSTINPNMALRMLLYAGRLYEKIVENKNIYSSKRLTIPRPEFYVLYNGTAPSPERWEIRLSDMFEDVGSLGLGGAAAAMLDLVVKVFNINDGQNEEIARRCETLRGYSVFVAKAREYQRAGHALQEAIKLAVKYCREHEILKGFLEEHSSEVSNMLLTEWSWDDALAVRYEEGRERGIKQGVRQGIKQGLAQGVQQGRGEERNYAVQNLLSYGMKPDDIARALKMPLDAVLGCQTTTTTTSGA